MCDDGFLVKIDVKGAHFAAMFSVKNVLSRTITPGTRIVLFLSQAYSRLIEGQCKYWRDKFSNCRLSGCYGHFGVSGKQTTPGHILHLP